MEMETSSEVHRLEMGSDASSCIGMETSSEAYPLEMGSDAS